MKPVTLEDTTQHFEQKLRQGVCPYCGTALRNKQCPYDGIKFGYALQRIEMKDNQKRRRRM